MSEYNAIIIDDNEVWLGIISETIQRYFGDRISVEKFSSFDKANERLKQSAPSFDLLITDILPFEGAIEYTGLTFVNFTSEIRNIPVIVVTAASAIVNLVLRDYNVVDVFEKRKWDIIPFTIAISKAIRERNRQILEEQKSNKASGNISKERADGVGAEKTVTDKIEANKPDLKKYHIG